MLPDPGPPPQQRPRIVTRAQIEAERNARAQQVPVAAASRPVAPPPPPPPGHTRWATFNQTERELTWIVVDRITSIHIQAPHVGTYPAGYATAIWRVVVKMSHDEVVRDFHASGYVAEGYNELDAYNRARIDAVSFAQSLAAQVDSRH